MRKPQKAADELLTKHFDRLVQMIESSTGSRGKHNADTRFIEPTLLEVNDTAHPTMC